MLHFRVVFPIAQALHLFPTVFFFSNYKSLVVLRSTTVQHLYKICHSTHKTTPEPHASSVPGTCIHFLSQVGSHLSNQKFLISYVSRRISSLYLSVIDRWSIIPQVPLQPAPEMYLFPLWQTSTLLQPLQKYDVVMEEFTMDTWVWKCLSLPFSSLDDCRLFHGADGFNEPWIILCSRLRMPSSEVIRFHGRGEVSPGVKGFWRMTEKLVDTVCDLLLI